MKAALSGRGAIWSSEVLANLGGAASWFGGVATAGTVGAGSSGKIVMILSAGIAATTGGGLR